ncbi:hypothetical protein D3C77_442820 [compost metagenome]
MADQSGQVGKFPLICIDGESFELRKFKRVVTDAIVGKIKSDNFVLLAKAFGSVREHSPILKSFIPMGDNDKTGSLLLCRKPGALQGVTVFQRDHEIARHCSNASFRDRFESVDSSLRYYTISAIGSLH